MTGRMRWGLAACLMLGCSRAPGADPQAIPVRIGALELRAELAADGPSRERGLMFRRDLAADAGMLFAYPRAGPRIFWMQNTYLPLSVAFLDERGVILNLEDMEAFDATTLHRSRGAARYALEVNQGWFERHGVHAGDRVEFRLPEEAIAP